MLANANPSIAGIVLAAGQSRRMGTNKLLLMLEGESLARRACRRALAARLDPLIAVLGHDAERVRMTLADLNCRFAFNSNAHGPMSGSLHAGLKCLPPDIDAVVVMLADMVHVTERMLGDLTALASTSNAPLIVSRYGDTLAPPVLFRRALFSDLLGSTGEGCGKAVIEQHRARAHFVDWPVAALGDVDTPDAYAELQYRERHVLN
jgi:molybdenum cofactor cytidylyltransferase